MRTIETEGPYDLEKLTTAVTETREMESRQALTSANQNIHSFLKEMDAFTSRHLADAEFTQKWRFAHQLDETRAAYLHLDSLTSDWSFVVAKHGKGPIYWTSGNALEEPPQGTEFTTRHQQLITSMLLEYLAANNVSPSGRLGHLAVARRFNRKPGATQPVSA